MTSHVPAGAPCETGAHVHETDQIKAYAVVYKRVR